MGFSFNEKIEIVGYVLIFSIILTSSMSGLSGGYMTVLILYLIFKFESRKTLGYAAFFNFISSSVNFSYYYFRKNPVKKYKTLVDYEMVLIMIPLSIIGVMIGDIVYVVFPMFVVAAIIAIVWTTFAIDIFIRAVKMYRMENSIKNYHKCDDPSTQKGSKNRQLSYEFVDALGSSRLELKRVSKYDPKTVSLNRDSEIESSDPMII